MLRRKKQQKPKGIPNKRPKQAPKIISMVIPNDDKKKKKVY